MVNQNNCVMENPNGHFNTIFNLKKIFQFCFQIQFWEIYLTDLLFYICFCYVQTFKTKHIQIDRNLNKYTFKNVKIYKQITPLFM